MALNYPGLVCDSLRPLFGAAAPLATAVLYHQVTGEPWPGVDDGEGG